MPNLTNKAISMGALLGALGGLMVAIAIINKSKKKDWGYKVSITVLVLHLIMILVLKTSGYAA